MNFLVFFQSIELRMNEHANYVFSYYTVTAALLLALEPNLQTEFVKEGQDLKAYVEGGGS